MLHLRFLLFPFPPVKQRKRKILDNKNLSQVSKTSGFREIMALVGVPKFSRAYKPGSRPVIEKKTGEACAQTCMRQWATSLEWPTKEIGTRDHLSSS